VSVRASIGLAAVAAGLLTLVASLKPVSSFASRDPALHVAAETAAALISIVAAQLVYGRFRQGGELRDLLLTASLCTFAVANLTFSLVPAIAHGERGVFATWAPAGGRLLASALLAFAALAPDRVLRRPQRELRRSLAACLAVLGGIGLCVALAGDALPPAVSPDLAPDDLDRLRVAGNPTLLAGQLVVVGLFAAAAVGFARRAEATGDELARWLAIAATLGAFSRLDFIRFPSLYTPYFSVGDFLRLGFFVALFVAGAVELRRGRGVLATAAVLEERHRIARDIHDGVAQDLAYIVLQARLLAAQPESPIALRHMVLAASRALDESRNAIAALTRSGGHSLLEAVRVTAVETAGREGGSVELDLEGTEDVAVPIRVQEVLLRVLREAIINAIRHGRAESIDVTLRGDPRPHLVVSDDGAGFDLAAAAESGRLGLRSMEARIRAVGGELTIDSTPGGGTRVEVRLP